MRKAGRRDGPKYTDAEPNVALRFLFPQRFRHIFHITSKNREKK